MNEDRPALSATELLQALKVLFNDVTVYITLILLGDHK